MPRYVSNGVQETTDLARLTVDDLVEVKCEVSLDEILQEVGVVSLTDRVKLKKAMRLISEPDKHDDDEVVGVVQPTKQITILK